MIWIVGAELDGDTRIAQRSVLRHPLESGMKLDLEATLGHPRCRHQGLKDCTHRIEGAAGGGGVHQEATADRSLRRQGKAWP